MMNEIIANLVHTANEVATVCKALKFDLIFSIAVNIVIVLILFKLVDIFILKLKKQGQKSDSSVLSGHLIPIIEKLIKIIVIFIVVASLLQSNGYSVTSLIAGFGITGLAVGFAAQQTIADFFGTLTILADKMYKIGDYIKIGDVEGYVEDINLLSTKVRTLDNFFVIIPNNNISSAVITNVSKAKKRRINEAFGVTYGTSNEKIQQAIDIMKNVCANREDIGKDYSVFIETLASSSINIRLWAYVKTGSYIKFAQVKSEIIMEIVKRFREEGIDFAFPSQSIYIEKQ